MFFARMLLEAAGHEGHEGHDHSEHMAHGSEDHSKHMEDNDMSEPKHKMGSMEEMDPMDAAMEDSAGQVATTDHSSHLQGAGDSAHDNHLSGHPLGFTWNTNQVLWFLDWDINNTGQYVVTIIGLILVAIFHEWLSAYRRQLFHRIYQPTLPAVTKQAENGVRSSKRNDIKYRLILGLIYAINVFLAYMLMLAIMTYNGGIFIAIVLGLAVGHAIFLRPSSGSFLSDACCAAEPE